MVGRWPFLLLMPIFSFYTFSYEKIGSKKFLVLSNKWTWANAVITLLGIIGAILYSAFGNFYHPSYRFYNSTYFNVLIFTIPAITMALIYNILLTFLKSCACCCQSQFPMHEKSGISIDDLSVVDLEQEKSRVARQIEMRPYE